MLNTKPDKIRLYVDIKQEREKKKFSKGSKITKNDFLLLIIPRRHIAFEKQRLDKKKYKKDAQNTINYHNKDKNAITVKIAYHYIQHKK